MSNSRQTDLREFQLFNLWLLKRGKDAGKFNRLLHAIAMTVIVLMRAGIGVDHLGYVEIAASTVLMLLASWVCNFSWLPFGLGHMGPQDNSLLFYAFAYFCLALYQRRKREREIKSGTLPEEFHTESVGRGRFDYLPLGNRFIGFVDPFVVLLGSALLVFRLHVGELLGLWGMLSGVAFLVAEGQVYANCEAMFRGSLNALSLAKMRGEVLSHIEEANITKQETQGVSMGSIATGADDLLLAEIARRGNNNS